MQNKLISELATSVIRAGKNTIDFKDLGYETPTIWTYRCREIYSLLSNQVNVSEPFPTKCRDLLQSINQKPTEDDLFLFITRLKDAYLAENSPEQVKVS